MPYSDRGLKFSLEGIIILGIVDLRSADALFYVTNELV